MHALLCKLSNSKMADVLRGGKDYQTVFDPGAYLREYLVETSDNWPFILSYLESLHKVDCEGKTHHIRFVVLLDYNILLA